MSKTPLLALISSLVAALSAFASAKGPAPKVVPLDTIEAHKLYLDGDFDKAIVKLEESLKANQLHSHQDSVFVFKHLGVMYAANDGTRERGKHYMYQLLSIEPTARIMDMFASDMIYMIFKNIQEEYETQSGRRHTSGAESPAATAKQENGSQNNPAIASKHSTQWPYWTAGAAAAVAGIGVTFYLMQDVPRPQRRLNVD